MKGKIVMKTPMNRNRYVITLRITAHDGLCRARPDTEDIDLAIEHSRSLRLIVNISQHKNDDKENKSHR